MAGWKNEQISLVSETSVPVDLVVPTKARGWMAPGPVLMETTFPLGLFRAWSRPDPGLKILVYPRPSPYSIPLEMLRSRVQQGRDIPSDEFQGLRPYTAGDSMARIDWRALARRQGLMTKSFRSDSRSDGLFLDLDVAPGKDLEERLSRLTRAALDAHASGLSFGLRLNQTIIEPDRGEAHSAQVLKALALYEPA